MSLNPASRNRDDRQDSPRPSVQLNNFRNCSVTTNFNGGCLPVVPPVPALAIIPSEPPPLPPPTTPPQPSDDGDFDEHISDGDDHSDGHSSDMTGSSCCPCACPYCTAHDAYTCVDECEPEPDPEQPLEDASPSGHGGHVGDTLEELLDAICDALPNPPNELPAPTVTVPSTADSRKRNGVWTCALRRQVAQQIFIKL